MPKVSADAAGSMLPAFIATLAAILFIAAGAVNLSALLLYRQQMQASADQLALRNSKLGIELTAETAMIRRCQRFEFPIGLVSVPTFTEICVKAAAR